jgi:hypothetical protein
MQSFTLFWGGGGGWVEGKIILNLCGKNGWVIPHKIQSTNLLHCTAPAKQNGPLGLFGDTVQAPPEASAFVAEAADSEPEVQGFESLHILQFLNLILIRISLMFRTFQSFENIPVPSREF